MNKPRLIDANKLLEDMKRLCGKDCGVCGYSTFLASDEHCGLIDEQPTAYDIQGVVEQLEGHAIEFETFGMCSDYVELTHAIEIVKGGAVDDETMA